MSDTSVIVATLRPEPYLERCLQSVCEEAAEIIVVDNASEGDAAARLAQKYGARHLRQDRNLGFTGGVNAGVAAARCAHVALLNDDAFAQPGWIAGSERVLADPAIGIVAPKLLFAWKRAVVRLDDPITMMGRDIQPHGRRVDSVLVGTTDVTGDVHALGVHSREGNAFWTSGAAMLVVPLPENRSDEIYVDGRRAEPEVTFDLVNNAGQYLDAGGWTGDIGYGARDDGSFDAPADRFGACGAAMVMRRETWERLGGLEEEFFSYYEDIDLSWRAQLAGLRVRYEPALVVRHVHSHTGVALSRWWQFFVARNRILCFARNAPDRVVARIVTELPPLPPGVPKSLARTLPAALAYRRRGARSALRSRESVWAQWAGVEAPQRP